MKFIFALCILLLLVDFSSATVIGPFGKTAGELMEIRGVVLPSEYKNKIKTKVTGYLVKVETVDGKIAEHEVVFEILPPKGKKSFVLKEGEKFSSMGYQSRKGGFIQRLTEGTPPKIIYFIQFFQCTGPLNTEQNTTPDPRASGR